MRAISTLVMFVALTGCAGAARTIEAPRVALEPRAVSVAEPLLPLAEQAGWPQDPAAAEDVAQALDHDPAVSASGVMALRKRGQAGLDALLASLGERAATDPAARAVVARTAAQLDAHASGLFWHTDRDEALARARAEKKPVLSLRLLGRLDEELSCANSRFFRTAVYSNASVAAYLRQRFVLHWSSERPAPRITIDYGDGRKLERTITGNSLHYVLAPDGRVVDALPGLYGAAAFIETLEAPRVEALSGGPPEIFTARLRGWHTTMSSNLRSRWTDDLTAFGLLPVGAAAVDPAPSAAAAAPIAATKMVVEAPMVDAVVPSADALAQRTDDAAWRQLAVRALDRVRLDGVSRALIRSKRPMAPMPSGVRPVEGVELERLFLAFEMRMAEDTVKNELVLHQRVHDWLAADALDFESLNARIYAELFLTPRSDPWLGMLPSDAFSGITNDGVVIGQR